MKLTEFLNEQKYSPTMNSNEMKFFVHSLHTVPEDWDDGDIEDRIFKYKTYNLKKIPIGKIDIEEFNINGGKVSEYMEEYKKNKEYPPVVVYKRGNHYAVIDGTHRLDALYRLGIKEVLAYVGTNKFLKESVEKKESFKAQITKFFDDLGRFTPPQDPEFDFDPDKAIYGYKLELFVNGTKVGQVISGFNKDGAFEYAPESDYDIYPEFQGKGFGKILLMLGIKHDTEILGQHYADSRGVTSQMRATYNSLLRDKIIKGAIGYSLTKLGEQRLAELNISEEETTKKASELLRKKK